MDLIYFIFCCCSNTEIDITQVTCVWELRSYKMSTRIRRYILPMHATLYYVMPYSKKCNHILLPTSSKSFSRLPGCLVVNHNSFTPQLLISAPIILDSASILPPFNTLCSKRKNLIRNTPQAKGPDPTNAQYWQVSRLIMASRAASGLDFHSACACAHILKCFK